MRPEILDGLRSDKMGLIILPTEDCNFRCTYCYEDFQQGKMSEETISRLKLFLEKNSKSTKFLNVEWFGGEPLAAYQVVKEISQHICDHYSDSNVSSSMTTNGSLLNKKRASELSDLGVTAYQISLDGYGAEHDKTRRRRDGSGTFKQIWNNLIDLRDSDINFLIKLRIHYSPTTLKNVPELLDKINDEFSGDRRFQLFVKAIGRYGGENDHEIPIFSHKAQKQIENKLIQLSGMTGAGGSRESSLEHIPVCYATKPNSYVIRANGTVSKCTVDLQRDKNVIGCLEEDGSISQDMDKVNYWIRGIFSDNEDQLLCPAHSSD